MLKFLAGQCLLYLIWPNILRGRDISRYKPFKHQTLQCSRPEALKIFAGILPNKVVAQWLRCCATNRKVAGSIPDGVIEIFRSHYKPGVDSVSKRNEYQEDFLGGKCGRCVRLATLPTSCAVVITSGNLNFVKPSGPLQTCNGTDLLLSTNKI